MLKNSRSALHAFLFDLRTPLASIRGAALLIDRAEMPDSLVPAEAREWLSKWLPKVDIWLKNAIELTELYAQSRAEDRDWKKLIQQLMSILEGVETAARDVKDIPLSGKESPGDVLHMIVSSIEYINNSYRAMQELLPTLD